MLLMILLIKVPSQLGPDLPFSESRNSGTLTSTTLETSYQCFVISNSQSIGGSCFAATCIILAVVTMCSLTLCLRNHPTKLPQLFGHLVLQRMVQAVQL